MPSTKKCLPGSWDWCWRSRYWMLRTCTTACGILIWRCRSATSALAQQRYTELLLGQIDALLAGHPAPRILDVGCGTGHMLQLLVERGYAVDAVNPSAQLNRQVRARLAAMQHTDSTLFESDFESLPLASCQQPL